MFYIFHSNDEIVSEELGKFFVFFCFGSLWTLPVELMLVARNP